MIKRGYKVVSKALYSAIVLDAKSEVQYSQERSALPQKGCGPLTVFTNLSAATLFSSKLTNTLVFECYYILSDKSEVWYRTGPPVLLDVLIGRNKACIIPDTVALAEEVILGKMVEICPKP